MSLKCPVWSDFSTQSVQKTISKRSPLDLDRKSIYHLKLNLDLNLKIIHHVAASLGIRTKLILQSGLSVDAKELELSVRLAEKLGATAFLAQGSARKYLDEDAFKRAGVALRFFNPRPPVYPQLWGGFIPNLSILDMLLNVGPGASRIIARM